MLFSGRFLLFCPLLLLLSLSSCRGTVPSSDEKIILYQVDKIKEENVAEALRLLSTVTDSLLTQEKTKILFQIYLDQREYQKANALLDSNFSVGPETLFFLSIKTKNSPLPYTNDIKINAIHQTINKNWDTALRLFSGLDTDTLDALLKYYHVKALMGAKDSAGALRVAKTIDGLPNYLLGDYHKMMVNLHIWSNPNQALRWVKLLKSSVLKLYYRYQITKKEKYLWKLIKKYPRSWATGEALQLTRPRTKGQYLVYGKAYFKRRKYSKAIVYLRKVKNSQSLFLIGLCLLRLGEKTDAYGYLKESGLPEAYYQIAQSLPDSEAIAYYQRITSKKARRSLKRNTMISHALALERMGSLGEAIKVELKFIDEFPGTATARRLLLRSAMNLIRLGDLKKADSLLSLDSLTAFYYWRGKIRAMMNESPDSFYALVKEKSPFSYYSIYRLKTFPKLDSTSLAAWVKSIDDRNKSDDAILQEVMYLIDLGLYDLADKALWYFSTYDPDLLHKLILKSKKLGFDWHAIRFARRLIKKGQRAGKDSFPIELIRLAYPIRYLPSLNEHGENITLLMALIWQESNFNPGAVSPAGAVGLLQIMPRTGRLIARDLEEHYAVDSLYNPMISIRYGTYYLSGIKDDMQSWIWALVGYNAGPHRIKRWIKTYPVNNPEVFIELIPFVETRNYVKRILKLNEIYDYLINSRDLP